MFVAFEFHSAISGPISLTICTIATRAASTLCKPHRKIFINLLKRKCRYFEETFITDFTGWQLSVQPVMKISSKWSYLRFSARASWIILTFGADLVHVYITRCGRVYSYKEKFTIHVFYVGPSHLIFSKYLFWFCVSNRNHKQTAQFHYCHSYTGPCIKWTFIWHFRISINRITYFIELDMSSARRRRKSPQSLSGTSTYPIMVTHRSLSWSWMVDSHPFRSMSVSPSSSQIRLFQTLTLKLQVQGHGCGPRAIPYSQPII